MIRSSVVEIVRHPKQEICHLQRVDYPCRFRPDVWNPSVLTVLHGAMGILVIGDVRRPEGYSDLLIGLDDGGLSVLTRGWQSRTHNQDKNK